MYQSQICVCACVCVRVHVLCVGVCSGDSGAVEMSWTQLEGDELLEPTVCKVCPVYPLKHNTGTRDNTH